MGRLSGEPQGVGPGVPRNEEKQSLVEMWAQLPSTPQSNTWPGASVYVSVQWGDRSKRHGKTGLLQTKLRPGVAADKRGDPRPAPPHPHLLPAALGVGVTFWRGTIPALVHVLVRPLGRRRCPPPARGPGVPQHPDLLGPLLSSVVQPQQPLWPQSPPPPHALPATDAPHPAHLGSRDQAPGGDPSSGRLPPRQAGGEGSHDRNPGSAPSPPPPPPPAVSSARRLPLPPAPARSLPAWGAALEPYQPVASGPALPGERDSDLESGPHHFGGSASRSPRHYFSTSRRCPQRGRQGRLTNRNLLRARPAQTRCVKVPGRSLRLRSPGGPRGAALLRCFLSTFLGPGHPVSELQGPFCLPAWPLLVF